MHLSQSFTSQDLLEITKLSAQLLGSVDSMKTSKKMGTLDFSFLLPVRCSAGLELLLLSDVLAGFFVGSYFSSPASTSLSEKDKEKIIKIPAVLTSKTISYHCQELSFLK